MYAGPGFDRLPSGSFRLSQTTMSASRASTAPATRSVVSTGRYFSATFPIRLMTPARIRASLSHHALNSSASW